MADKAFGENKNSMLAATAFVGWRLMANALEGNNGKHIFSKWKRILHYVLTKNVQTQLHVYYETWPSSSTMIT